MGQRFGFKNVGTEPINISLLTEKTVTAAKGLLQGEDGAMGSYQIIPERPFPAKGLDKLYPGEEIILTLPGGAGYGPATLRDQNAIDEDRTMGYI